MLTAWSAAGVIGPLVFAQFKGQALYIASGLLTLGLVVALVYKRPAPKVAAVVAEGEPRVEHAVQPLSGAAGAPVAQGGQPAATDAKAP